MSYRPDANADPSDPHHPENMHMDGDLEREDRPRRRPLFERDKSVDELEREALERWERGE